ncbi:MAG: T9SS type A sorting domain-containing protein [Rhodothermales bacterium]
MKAKLHASKKSMLLILTLVLGGTVHALRGGLLSVMILVFLCSPLVVSAQTESPGDMVSNPILGVQKVLFIRVIYPDDNQVFLSDERAPIHADALNAIMKANSYDQLSLDIDITPVLMMPQPTSFYALDNRQSFVRIRADAIKIAEEAGFLESDYDREAIFTKKLWPQPFRGVGGVNIRTFYSKFDKPSHSAHEMGHSFDWRHANFWRVTSANPIDTAGVLIEYGDKFDIMGDWANFHHFNPWYKSRVGWLPPESILTVSEPGTYTIRALEKPPLSGPAVTEFSALRIRRNPGAEYWVYYRSLEDSANAGAMISLIQPKNTSKSLLLDMTPGSKNNPERDHVDAALTVGKTVRDQEAGIEITVLEKYSDSLRVQVVVPGDPMDTLPVIDIVNPTFGKTVRGAIAYEATAFDPDVGTVNGAGIDTVRFVLNYIEGDDPFGEGTTPIIVATNQLTSPPYIFHVETTGLPDESYRLHVEAVSQNGGANTAALSHIIDNTGPSVPTSVDEEPVDVPYTFQLQQNYPNPFNPSTTIHYSLEQAGTVELSVYDLLGRKVRSLIQANKPAGAYSVRWNGRDDAGRRVASGTYFYQLRVGSFISTRRMVLLK